MSKIIEVKQVLELKRFDNPGGGGYRAQHTFQNGYGISVVQYDNTFEQDNGLYQVAVMLDGEPCYDTPITSDVISNVTPKEVTEISKQIMNLPTIQKGQS